jgi:hypothetical protein
MKSNNVFLHELFLDIIIVITFYYPKNAELLEVYLHNDYGMNTLCLMLFE